MAHTDADTLRIRRAEPSDTDALAALFTATRAAAVPAMPPPTHSPEEDRAFLAGLLVGDATIWVAESSDGHPVGFAVIEGSWLHSLYVHPEHAGGGIGSALLDVVKAERPDGFCLWVFESNLPARTFYRERGLVELEHTDGSGNEEHAPDLRMAWAGREPLAFLRVLIDEVDAELGAVLARRAALTAAVQHLKALTVGSTSRDSEREAEIVAALARKAPALGRERLERILHVIISESLGASGADGS